MSQRSPTRAHGDAERRPAVDKVDPTPDTGVHLSVRPGWTAPHLAALFGGATPPERMPRRSFDT